MIIIGYVIVLFIALTGYVTSRVLGGPVQRVPSEKECYENCQQILKKRDPDWTPPTPKWHHARIK